MFKVEEVDGLINSMLRHVSPSIRDDCYQAAYLGVMEASKHYDPSKAKFTTYLNTHKGYIQNEIFKEVARLTFPFVVSKGTLMHLIKYRRDETGKMTDNKIKSMKNLDSIRQYSYDKDSEN